MKNFIEDVVYPQGIIEYEQVKNITFEEAYKSNKFAIDPGKLDINIQNTLRENLIRSLKDDYRNSYKVKIKKYFRELEY